LFIKITWTFNKGYIRKNMGWFYNLFCCFSDEDRDENTKDTGDTPKSLILPSPALCIDEEENIPLFIPKELSDEQIKRLKQSTVTNTPLLKFDKQRFQAYVTDCYDGDTIHISFFLGKNDVFQIKCRLDGIDCPEMIPKKPKSEELKIKEKRMAKISKDFLISKIQNQIVTIESTKYDKYGRLMIIVFLQDEIKSINDVMLELRYAHPYNGEKKKPFEDYLDYYSQHLKS
jgi:endonuclease YncB( thermonuclease family)